MLSGLLIWFLHTGSCFFVTTHLSAFKLNSNFQYFPNKLRQSRRSEYNIG